MQSHKEIQSTTPEGLRSLTSYTETPRINYWKVDCNMKTVYSSCPSLHSKRLQKISMSKKEQWLSRLLVYSHPSMRTMPSLFRAAKARLSRTERCATSASAIFLSSTSLQSSNFRINLLLATGNAHRNKTQSEDHH